MTKTLRGAKPAWKPPYIRARVPVMDHTYVEAEDRAYHRVNGMPFRRRVKPEIPATGRHPRSAYKHLPGIPTKIKNLRGQLHTWHIAELQENPDA